MPDISTHTVHQSARRFLRNHLFSIDHKVIGKQYYLLGVLAVLIGIVLSWLMRLHLVWPNSAIPGLRFLSPIGAPGGVIAPEYYLQLMTMHGTLMVFFVLTTVPLAGFGNYFLPIQIGAEGMAFPRLHMISFWATFVGFCVLIAAFFVGDGPPLSGWTSYPPLSALAGTGPGQATGQTLWAVSIAIFCIGQLLGSVNLITTTLERRTKGMTLMRMPLTTWAWFITSCMALLAFAVLLPACILLVLDRVAGTSFFVPSNLVLNDQLQTQHSGGSPLLWQHLFWFFGHPEVYIAILPAAGIVSHILSNSYRRPLLSNRLVIYCMMAIAFLSYLVWGHHMFVSGMNPFSALAFSLPTLVITIPSTIITLIWIGSLYGAKLQINTASLFALGFISVFVSGGVSGFFLAQPSTDSYLHATYFVVGHFHMVMGVAATFAMFAGTYFWAPKIFGRMMNETLGKIHFWGTFVGAYCIFMPFHYLGLVGVVRRYSQFVADYQASTLPVQKFITAAALFTGGVQLIFLYNLVYSRFKGTLAPHNPWQCTSLEWTIAAPPPANNFGGKYPVVYHDPYLYGIEGSSADYVMQNSPEQIQQSNAKIQIRKMGTTLQPAILTETSPTGHRKILQHGPGTSSTGVWMGISAITMIFAAITSAMVVRQGSGNDWRHFSFPITVYFTTAALIISSATFQIARQRLTSQISRPAHNAHSALRALYGTFVLGCTFVIGQFTALQHLRSDGIDLTYAPSSSFFNVFAVLVALHVIGGLVGLLYVIRKLHRGLLRMGTIDAALQYWHFMGLLWIALLFLLRTRI
jgi:cytochrome c oxidase subunit I